MPLATGNLAGTVLEVPINPFQQTMLCWNDLMPYNAVHVARLRGQLEPEKLRTAVEEVLRARQLTDLSIDRVKKRFYYGNTFRPSEFSVIPIKENARDALNQRTEMELGTPFDCTDGFNPIRIFVLQVTGSFYFGLVYFHAIADGEAIIQVLRQIIDLYLYNRPPVSNQGHGICTTGLWRHFSKNPAWILRWLFALRPHLREIQHCVKPPFRTDQTPRTVFKLYDFDASALPILTRYAHGLQVTLNDLFLGALMKALSPYAKARFHAGRRRNLAIAFITNIRRDLMGLKENTFGMFLGSNHVAHPLPATTQLDQLLRDISSQTRRIKEKRLYAVNLLGQMVGVRMMRRLDPAKRMRFYAEGYPLWGGITNLDLSWYWKELPDDDFYYFRAASISPASPLNLVITTVNQRVNVAVSANPCVYTTEEVENIMDTFLNTLPSSADSER